MGLVWTVLLAWSTAFGKNGLGRAEPHWVELFWVARHARYLTTENLVVSRKGRGERKDIGGICERWRL